MTDSKEQQLRADAMQEMTDSELRALAATLAAAAIADRAADRGDLADGEAALAEKILPKESEA